MPSHYSNRRQPNALQGLLSPIGELRSGIKMGLNPIYAEQVEYQRYAREQQAIARAAAAARAERAEQRALAAEGRYQSADRRADVRLRMSQQAAAESRRRYEEGRAESGRRFGIQEARAGRGEQRAERGFSQSKKQQEISSLMAIIRDKETYTDSMREQAATQLANRIPGGQEAIAKGQILRPKDPEKGYTGKELLAIIETAGRIQKKAEEDGGEITQTVVGDYQQRALDELARLSGQQVVSGKRELPPKWWRNDPKYEEFTELQPLPSYNVPDFGAMGGGEEALGGPEFIEQPPGAGSLGAIQPPPQFGAPQPPEIAPIVEPAPIEIGGDEEEAVEAVPTDQRGQVDEKSMELFYRMAAIRLGPNASDEAVRDLALELASKGGQ
jgi:hypothetical protein